jgi:DNA-binding NarL/FixJ family response regulator
MVQRRRPPPSATARGDRRARRAAAGSPARVLLVDDHAGSRAALRRALADRREVTLAGEVAAGEAAAEAARQVRPDVAIVNLSVTADRVAECVLPLLRAQPGLRVVVVCLPDAAALSAAARAAGAAESLVRKTSLPDATAAVKAAARLALRARDTRAPAPPPADDPPAAASRRLSRREQQVLELLARGHTRREIADRLGIGVKSIETYRFRLAQKVGARTRAELVRFALESGMLAGAALTAVAARP